MDGRRVRRQCGATHAQERGDRQLFLRRVGDRQGRRGEPGGVPGCGGQFRRLRRAASPPAPVGAASAASSTAVSAEIKSSRRSEEHTSELQSLMRNSYAVFCLKKKHKHKNKTKTSHYNER